MFDDKVTDILDELTELAKWEGCETGDLCYSLIELYEGNSGYASDTFQKALAVEMLTIYDDLKESKADEDAEEAEYDAIALAAGEGKRVKVSIGETEFSFSTLENVKSPEDFVKVLKEAIKMLEAPTVPDDDIF